MVNSLLSNIVNHELINANCFKVAILLATHNGISWISTQIDSILSQEDVNVTIYVSDDSSQDGTYEYLLRRSELDTQVKVLSKKDPFGSAGKNFYRLILEVDISSFEYIACADQDDIWESDKLIRHIQLAKQYSADGVSSNVMAFWPEGRKKLIDKSQPQRGLDYLFESAGPGCTFLMTPRLVKAVRDQLLDDESPARNVSLHDWLCYAVCRASGYKWVIDSAPSVMYRQHGSNVIGANVGFRAKLNRLLKIKVGWYRGEVLKIVEVCSRIKPNLQVNDVRKILVTGSYFARLKLITYVPQARRKLADRVLLAFAILLGLF